jgi:hypothetical protein
MSEERHFGGEVQEKKPSYFEDLNTIDTKSVDGQQAAVIAPFPFALRLTTSWSGAYVGVVCA